MLARAMAKATLQQRFQNLLAWINLWVHGLRCGWKLVSGEWTHDNLCVLEQAALSFGFIMGPWVTMCFVQSYTLFGKIIKSLWAIAGVTILEVVSALPPYPCHIER